MCGKKKHANATGFLLFISIACTRSYLDNVPTPYNFWCGKGWENYFNLQYSLLFESQFAVNKTPEFATGTWHLGSVASTSLPLSLPDLL